MTCTGCGFEASPDFAFCPKCGARLPVLCPGCGAACAPDFAFCPKCGARLAGPSPDPAPTAPPPAAAAPRGEARPDTDRRAVTVLFADLSGFTALSERLDPEDVRAFQSDLFATLAGVVERYEGFVEKFVGDAVMAVFGAPSAHEDDPERALHAALAMHAQMRPLAARWEPCFGSPVALHVGVNTGPVVAGTLGAAASAAYAVTGDTVNTAARLLSAAAAGETLVAASTHRLTEHAFGFDPAEALTVKGKREPVPTYRLLSALEAPQPLRGLEAHGLVAPLVGRDEELGQLHAAFERMLAGSAQVVSLVGEAGVGKSRLLAEFLGGLEAEGRLRDVTVRRAVCSALGEQTYGVFAAFLRQAFGITGEDTPAAAADRVVAGVREIGIGEAEASAITPILAWVQGFASEEAVRHVEPEQLKRQIFLAARRLLERRLEQGPLLLLVEDLHWADAASVELLRFAADRLAARPLMVLVTHRPGFEAQGLVTARVTSTIIRLAPLGRSEAARILGAFFHASLPRIPDRLRDLVVERAGGNPLYLEEIVRELIAGGVLRREGEGWACAQGDAVVDVPRTIEALLLSRIDRVPRPARRVLQDAAVLGDTFDLALLRIVSDIGDALDSALDLLQEVELVEEVPRARAESGEPRYRFVHSLIQEVVYGNVLLSRRAELHRRAGEGLEVLCGGRPHRLEEIEALAHHFSLSGDRPRGVRYLLLAGDRARVVYANDDALRHYALAFQTIAGCAGYEREELEVRERLGDLLALTGQRGAALEHYEAVLARAEELGDAEIQGRMHRKVGGLLWDASERQRALEAFQRGLEVLAPGTHDIERAHLFQEMGRLAFRSGDNPRAIEWAEQALTLAQHALDRAGGEGPEAVGAEAAAVIAQSRNTLGVAWARLGERERAISEIERSVEVARAHDLLRVACRAYTNLGVLHSQVDPRKGIDTCLTGLETARKIGDLGFQSWLYANLAVAYCALTDRCEEEGIQAALQAIDLDRQLGQLDHLAVPLIVLGQIYQCEGETERALGYYGEALALAERMGEPQLLFPCYDGLATLHLDLGDEARAEAYMLKAQEVCERAGLEPDSLVVLPFLG